MKQFLNLTVALMMVVMISACGGGGGGSSLPTTINVADNGNNSGPTRTNEGTETGEIAAVARAIAKDDADRIASATEAEDEAEANAKAIADADAAAETEAVAAAKAATEAKRLADIANSAARFSALAEAAARAAAKAIADALAAAKAKAEADALAKAEADALAEAEAIAKAKADALAKIPLPQVPQPERNQPPDNEIRAIRAVVDAAERKARGLESEIRLAVLTERRILAETWPEIFTYRGENYVGERYLPGRKELRYFLGTVGAIDKNGLVGRVFRDTFAAARATAGVETNAELTEEEYNTVDAVAIANARIAEDAYDAAVANALAKINSLRISVAIANAEEKRLKADLRDRFANFNAIGQFIPSPPTPRRTYDPTDTRWAPHYESLPAHVDASVLDNYRSYGASEIHREPLHSAPAGSRKLFPEEKEIKFRVWYDREYFTVYDSNCGSRPPPCLRHTDDGIRDPEGRPVYYVHSLEYAALGIWTNRKHPTIGEFDHYYRYDTFGGKNLVTPPSGPSGISVQATYDVEGDAVYKGVNFFPDGELTMDFGNNALTGQISASGDAANRADDFGSSDALLPVGADGIRTVTSADTLAITFDSQIDHSAGKPIPFFLEYGRIYLPGYQINPDRQHGAATIVGGGFFADLNGHTGHLFGRFYDDRGTYDSLTAPAELSGHFWTDVDGIPGGDGPRAINELQMGILGKLRQQP